MQQRASGRSGGLTPSGPRRGWTEQAPSRRRTSRNDRASKGMHFGCVDTPLGYCRRRIRRTRPYIAVEIPVALPPVTTDRPQVSPPVVLANWTTTASMSS